MKKAVAYLFPFMEAEKARKSPPVKGEGAGQDRARDREGRRARHRQEHRGVVLACNNYEVIDMGVMVPCEKILAGRRSERRPDRLERADHALARRDGARAREMERTGFKLPLLIGGATTSKAHTAVKIAPHYSEPVVHVLDASRAVP